MAAEDRVIRRARGAIAILESTCANLDATRDSSKGVNAEGFVVLTEYESDNLCDAGGKLLAAYMTNICKGCDFAEGVRLNHSMEESIQSQLLVESDCTRLYSSAFIRYLLRQASRPPPSDGRVHDGQECMVFPVKPLMRYLPARWVLSLISDFSIADGFVRIELEGHCVNFLHKIGRVACQGSPLQREVHLRYIEKHLTTNGTSKSIPLDHFCCSQPWIAYWALHSLRVLDIDISPYRDRTVQTLFECWDPDCGGFSGGPGQVAHLATTFAAVCCLKMFDSLHLLDLKKLRSFLLEMKQPDGSFTVHRNGECDVRGTYCAVAAASIAGILDEELSEAVADNLVSCQSYDGGISGGPHQESHAGYVYCGAAALTILGSLDRIDKARLRDWCLSRQTPQFGFQGRPHKLVDVCYSFWVGATLALLGVSADETYKLRHQLLEAFILCVAQAPTGGFRDKPGKPVDLYHTCYALSALEVISKPREECRIDFAFNMIF
ncbi:farnesyl-protein transferase beta subunit [Babesia caballi]|uniref:Protein farnesyltransferase subunit beta n=1 Tax=Babesia caballi TaxID=5871 RepID=A0AAV4LP61_BABCB|nr:farnesyl-protein transferase beta subunit [Babesia caballi]